MSTYVNIFVFLNSYYSLNIYAPQNMYVQILTSCVMVWEVGPLGGAWV